MSKEMLNIQGGNALLASIELFSIISPWNYTTQLYFEFRIILTNDF